MRSDASHHPAHHCWMRSGDYQSRGSLLARLWLRSDIPIIRISKVTLGTVGDAGDA